MRVVLDTNVFVSGVFFSGPPQRILNAWRDQRVTIVYSAAIFREYERVLLELAGGFPEVDGRPAIQLLLRRGEIIQSVKASGIECRDPTDVKFIDCLLQSKAECLISGDKDLLSVRLKSACIVSPRQFCDRYL